MKNKTLAEDYIQRSEIRLKALETLFKEGGFADVVREAQEVVELSLKALLRIHNITTPRVHDVSAIIEENRQSMHSLDEKEIDLICEISRTLRRDRELSFYGTEDLTPSEFYQKKDAKIAKEQAGKVVTIVKKTLL